MLSDQQITKAILHENYMRVRARMTRRIVEVTQVLDEVSVPAVSEEDLVAYKQASAGSIKEIVRYVGARYNIPPADIMSDRRTAKIVQARQIAQYIARRTTRFSFPQIGRKFNRDHTSVIHAVFTVEERMKADKDFAETISEMVDAFLDPAGSRR